MNDTRMTIDEAARLLSISAASVRNWVKAGRIRCERDGRSLSFERAHVEALRREIESGGMRRLQSRRNKTAASGTVVPAGYVRSKAYERIAAETAAIAADRLPPRLALLELALQQLARRGHLGGRPDAAAGSASLAARFLAGTLDAGGLAPLMRELCGPADAAVPADADAMRRLREIAALPFDDAEGDDLLGLVYMALARIGDRKVTGTYYTPSAVVDELVDDALDRLSADAAELPAIIDPCCGSGNFLIRIYAKLKRRLTSRGSAPDAADRLLRGKLAGCDIDGTAVTLAKLNLALLAEPGTWAANAESAAFPIHDRNTLEGHGTLFGSDDAGAYGLVIGNPPWGYHYTPEEIAAYKRQFTTADGSGSPESFCLFVEAGLGLLRDGGLLAYVLPESLLQVKAHAETRKLLAETTELQGIRLAGSPFAGVHSPVITLTARKRPPADGHSVTVEGGGADKPLLIPQRRFRGNADYAFNVAASNDEQSLLERMRGMTGAWYLAGQCDFALGIVTGNNQAFVLNGEPEGSEPVLKGSDVFKYNAYPGKQSIVFAPERFQQVAPERFYRAPEKLIYRFINATLVFAYDDRQTLSLNSANVIVPRVPRVSIKYVLAVLNSRAAQFYHAFGHSSVKVLRKHIESMPMPPCSDEEQQRIVAFADRLIASADPAERAALYEAIDDCVMALYGFGEAERRLIAARVGEPKFLNRNG